MEVDLALTAKSYAYLSGAGLSALWTIPFAGLLLSIAFLPLFAPHFWHGHFGKIAATWSLGFLIPALYVFGGAVVLHEFIYAMFMEYIPFIILLTALFTTGGGVRLKGKLPGTPAMNTLLLTVGTFLASIMGTTGAAMLLIRPLILSNLNRRYRVHVMVFFIFLVANIGGSLTPLGDPPLFLGFLNGVDFFWPLQNMLLPMLVAVILLLAMFYGVDTALFRREQKAADKPQPKAPPLRLKDIEIDGKINFILILGILAAVIMSGLWKPGIDFNLYGVTVTLQSLVREALLIIITLLSLRLTSVFCRKRNGFSWFPMIEVATLFICIFICMIPALKILKAGMDGALAPLVMVLKDANGEPVNALYFWITGVLSAFLDNAPTYLVFFNTAGGDAVTLMTQIPMTLLAISAGAVFFGAMSYIGNAPNFMVKAIAEERGIKMPSFFGYMLWSIGILTPIYLLITLLFFL